MAKVLRPEAEVNKVLEGMTIPAVLERSLAGTSPSPIPRSTMKKILPLALLLLSGTLSAQYHSKGRSHLSLGLGLGGHATQIDQRFTLSIFGTPVSFENSETSSAATTTIPLEYAYGLGDRFSLGLAIELGNYVPDSNATVEQSNNVAIVALQPRFYLVNGDRFAWMASLQLGAAALRIKDDTPGRTIDERYAGPAFGIGTGIGIGLGETVGLEFHVRYLATRMELRAREFNDRSTMDFYNATLSTGGIMGQVSLSFRFGG
jgi:hypothetical protein